MVYGSRHGIKVFAIFIHISQHHITLTFPTWKGCFIHFIFYPHIRLWPSSTDNSQGSKGKVKNDSAVKKYFYLTRILYFNNEETTFQMVIPVYGNRHWWKSQSEWNKFTANGKRTVQFHIANVTVPDWQTFVLHCKPSFSIPSRWFVIPSGHCQATH